MQNRFLRKVNNDKNKMPKRKLIWPAGKDNEFTEVQGNPVSMVPTL